MSEQATESAVWWVRDRATLRKILPVGHGLAERQQNFMSAMLVELLLRADEEAFQRGMRTAYESMGAPLPATPLDQGSATAAVPQGQDSLRAR